MNKTKIPRNFQLLNAINKAGNYTHVTYGLTAENDDEYKNNFAKMIWWDCTMIYDDGVNFTIFEAKCECTNKYPHEAPRLQFSPLFLDNDLIKNICDSEGFLLPHIKSAIKWNENQLLGDYLTNVLNIIRNH